ncbi:MAG: AfsR family transcriptional regulator [Pseudonocardiales bacterium]|nr:MAG: AfsR family transcriptional regulator [Pseudonocardiales bacterium]
MSHEGVYRSGERLVTKRQRVATLGASPAGAAEQRGGGMDFEILGPLRARQGEQPVQLSAPMPRTLLGVLLTRSNTPVPVDLLVDALWAGERDPRAAKKLQLHVHRLRRALGDPGRIRFDNGGYTLLVHPGELDAERFESALADSTAISEPARAVGMLRTALRLWRGDPFSDITDLPLLRAEADRLTERRLAGLAQLYCAELACGHANAIIPELAELAAGHPMREQLQGLLMTALYQAGRQAEALEVYHRTRSALVEQLGLEPGNELQRLEHAILTGDPMLEAPTTPFITPAQLPADITDFTGRRAQLATVAHLAAAADRVATVLVAITGKAGVGKTTLAVRAAHRLRAQYPDGQLFVDLRGHAHPLTPADVLARFLRSLGVDRMAIPEDADERAALYRSRLADRRLLIVLDNAECEAQLRPLLPGTPGCAVLVTSRTRLAGLTGARLVDLDIFEADQAVELLARLAGPRRVATEPAAAREIVRLCGFLPLALRVAGARLGSRRHWPLSRLEADLANEQHRLDKLQLGDLDVRASLALSYRGLDAMPRRAFRLLGLLEVRDFAPWVAAAMLDISQLQAEELVDTLVDTHLLDVAGQGGSGQLRYRFHDLLRAYAREVAGAEETAADRQAALDRAFGGWLALAEGAACYLTSSTLAETFESGIGWRPDGAILKAVITDPCGWFKVEWPAVAGAVEQAFCVESGQLGWALGVRLARIFLVRGYYDDWRNVCELMVTGARRAADGAADGMALRAPAELHRLALRLDEALEGVEEILRACAGAGGRAGHPTVAGSIGSVSEALPRLDSALTSLRESADPHSDAAAMRRLGTVHRLQRSQEKAARCVQQVLEALDVFSDPVPGVALVPSGVSSEPARSVRLAALQGVPHAGW